MQQRLRAARWPCTYVCCMLQELCSEVEERLIIEQRFDTQCGYALLRAKLCHLQGFPCVLTLLQANQAARPPMVRIWPTRVFIQQPQFWELIPKRAEQSHHCIIPDYASLLCILYLTVGSKWTSFNPLSDTVTACTQLSSPSATSKAFLAHSWGPFSGVSSSRSPFLGAKANVQTYFGTDWLGLQSARARREHHIKTCRTIYTWHWPNKAMP